MENSDKDLAIIRIYSGSELYDIHSMSIFHRKYIKSQGQQCGCFCCLSMFDSKEIIEWTDNNRTALCPECCIDSVIYQNDEYPLTENLLMQMEKRYFGSGRLDSI